MDGDLPIRLEDERRPALTSAALDGNLNSIRLLLNQGADVNAPGGVYGNALAAAASRGKLDIINLLLDRGADANAPGGDFKTPLQYAVLGGKLDAIRLLLDRGADANGIGGAALQDAATARGKVETVNLLLDRGADVNASGRQFGTALQSAAYHGKLEILQVLLARGADVSASGGEYGNALQAASFNGNVEIMKLLLDRGADVNASGGKCGNALQAATHGGVWDQYFDAAKLLVDRGADVNASGGLRGNALRAALWSENFRVAELLLDRGAYVNAPTGKFGNYLKAALLAGTRNLDFVKLLIDHGVDVKARSRAALHIAAVDGSLDILELLLDHGADVNIQGGNYGTALQAAAYGNSASLATAKFLLDRGADANIQGGEFGNALQAAAYAPHGAFDVVELLLHRGADVNAPGGRFGSALQAAASAACENLDLVKLILNSGADVNAQGGWHGSALQAAVSMGRHKVVKLFLENGVDISLPAVDLQGASLLHAAVACKDINTLDLLLEAGAHVHLGHHDIFNQTLLHISVDHPESFQSLKRALLKAHNDQNEDVLAVLQTAINKGDGDGCTPLHRAIEKDCFQAAEWLVNHGASVDIQDFNNVTPFQRAAQLGNFKMMSCLFPHMAQSLATTDQTAKGIDWKACAPSTWKDNIVLALNTRDIPPVQVMDGHELTLYFHTMSYPLRFSASIMSTKGNECIAAAPFQRALVLLPNDSLLGHSSGGVYWRWWRKIMNKRPDQPTMQTWRDQWDWKVQFNKIPNAVALGQPSRTECFLECRVVIPSFEILHTSTQLSASPLTTRPKNHAMVWIMVKSDENPPPAQPGKAMFGNKIIFTTLDYCRISKSPTDFFIPCVEQLREEWTKICGAAESHLSNMRSVTLRSNGRDTDLIEVHLKDAEAWAGFNKLLTTQMSILRSLCKSFDQPNAQAVRGDSLVWTNYLRDSFSSEIEATEKEVKGRFSSLNQGSQELIQLEFNLTSIAEAQKSTTMNRSMKRLSWITVGTCLLLVRSSTDFEQSLFSFH
ncbi:unnamed protein product [Penicillium salamii]|nr:unnamed protein product [Penicillium salamii]CAG8380045.1 unnamed protein product [Penicillium salamii]